MTKRIQIPSLHQNQFINIIILLSLGIIIMGILIYYNVYTSDKLLITTPEDFSNQNINIIPTKDGTITYNTNARVNPVLISSMLNWTRFSTKGNEDYSSVKRKEFTTQNNNYSFLYPDDYYILEKPEINSNDFSTLYITNNLESKKYIENYITCINDAIENNIFEKSETGPYCELFNGNFLSLFISPTSEELLFTETSRIPKDLNQVEIDSGTHAFLWNETAFLVNNYKIFSKIESAITLGVIDSPLYEYRMKLYTPSAQSYAALLFNTSFNPINSTIPLTIASIADSFTINK